MTKNEILQELADNKMIEEFVSNTAKTSNEDIKDLCQDIYLALAMYDEEKMVRMYEKGELQFFIARMITNQVRSQTSPFYCRYKRWTTKRSDLNDIKDRE